VENDNDTIFILTREDVMECAREMDIPAEAITDDVLVPGEERRGVGTGMLVGGRERGHQYGSQELG
jgi:hypothetical protein